MTMPAIRRALMLAAFALLSGCAAISAVTQASRSLEIYELRPPDLPPIAPARGVELVIEEPMTSGALATDRIMIRPGPLQAQYLPGVRWADPAPAMVQTMILRTVMTTGAVGSAGRRPLGGSADFAMLSELTDFQAEIGPGPDETTIRLGLIVRLVRERDAEVVADRTFVTSVRAAGSETGLIVQAFDLAARQMVSDLVPWVVSAARRSYRPSSG